VINVIYFIDTSAVLEGALSLYDHNHIYLSPLVLMELENLKTNGNEHLKFRAREAIRTIIQSEIAMTTISQKKILNLMKKNNYFMDINDHKMICEALILNNYNEVTFITSDYAQLLFARTSGLKTSYFAPIEGKNKELFYCGYGKYYPTDDELIALYTEGLNENILNAKVNEYCEIFNHEGTLSDILRWDGKSYQHLKYTNIENKTLGIKVSPRNLNQKMMFDLLQNPDIPIKLITGVYGSGKDYCALIHALNLIEKGKKNKLVFVRNLIDLKDTPQIGFLPNDIEHKIGWGLGPIKDILGGDEALEIFTSQNQIEAVNLGFCRGRSWENAIIYVTEGQNLTSSQIKLLISRLGEGSELIINGDYHGQVDKEIFEKDNGIKAMQNKLVGQPMFGCIDLIKTERSKVAEMASLLD
jgi:PhoH-like ATPase